MAWTTPITAVVNSIFTASQWNTGVRDNFLETAPGISTTTGRLIVSNGPNSVEQREIAQTTNDAAGTTTSTTYTATLTGGGTSPAVTVDCGFHALIFMSSAIANSSTNSSVLSFAVSGNTTSAAADSRALIMDGGTAKDDRMGVTNLFGNLSSPGSHTFTMQYKVSASTGTFTRRRIQVIAL